MNSADKFDLCMGPIVIINWVHKYHSAIIFCCKQDGDIFKWKIEKMKVNIPRRGYVIGKLKAKDTAVKGKRFQSETRSSSEY